MNNKRYQPFKMKILAAVVVANAVAMALVPALPHILPEPPASRALRETAAAIERAADGEKAVTGAVIEVSRLAGRSGYEIAVRDAIRDHDANMASLRKNAAILSGIRNPYENNLLIGTVIALIAAQSCCLFAFLLVTAGRAEAEADGMSRRIDDMVAVNTTPSVKKMKEKPVSTEKINSRLKN